MSDRGDDRLFWGGLKDYVDGSLGSTTAWFYAPYDDAPGTTGLMVTDTADLRRWIIAADSACLQVMVHAIGDRANDWLLDAFRSLLRARARLTFGSDWTVAPIDPILGIYAAVTRQTIDGANPNGWVPQERISVAEAMTAYTMNNAYASFREDALGDLQLGKLGDLVVLSDDIFAIDPVDIEEVKIDLTVMGGEIVYRRAR